MASCGVRESIRFLAQHNMVDVIVASAGGVEEDFIKCLAPTFLGDFALRGKELREKGINRIGNLLVPNDNYCKFEDWIMPILDQVRIRVRHQCGHITKEILLYSDGERAEGERHSLDSVEDDPAAGRGDQG